MKAFIESRVRRNVTPRVSGSVFELSADEFSWLVFSSPGRRIGVTMRYVALVVGARLKRLTMPRRGMQRVAVVAVVVASGLLLIPPAAPSSASTPNSSAFSESATLVSHALSVCVDLTVTGTFTYNATRDVTARGVQFSLSSIQISDSVLKAVVHRWSADTGCTAARINVARITLWEQWSPYAASRPQTTDKNSFGHGDTFTHQGAPIAFARQASVAGAPTSCYRVLLAAEYLRDLPHSETSDNGSSANKVCLTPTY